MRLCFVKQNKGRIFQTDVFSKHFPEHFLKLLLRKKAYVLPFLSRTSG